MLEVDAASMMSIFRRRVQWPDFLLLISGTEEGLQSNDLLQDADGVVANIETPDTVARQSDASRIGRGRPLTENAVANIARAHIERLT